MGREAFASIVPSGSEDSFSDTMARLLDRIDFRLANSDEERKAIFRLRYQAYLRDGMISPDPSEAFSDAYDEIGNVYLLGAYIDGDLASSIRLHVASSKNPEFPSFETFADILQPELDAGKVIIDALALPPMRNTRGSIADCRMRRSGFVCWRRETLALIFFWPRSGRSNVCSMSNRSTTG